MPRSPHTGVLTVTNASGSVEIADTDHTGERDRPAP
jgi:hypothetical protein